MKYRTVFHPDARAELRKLDRKQAMNILRKLGELEQDPLGLATTALVSDPDTRRLRIGDYRVFYRVHDNQLLILVVRIAHRSGAY